MINTSQALEIATLGTIGLSQIASIFPIPVVKDSLEISGRYTCRLRELPNELMFYFPMMMALDRNDSASETLKTLLEGHQNVFGRTSNKVTGKSGISNARIRVGFEPLKLVFDSVCKPLAKDITPQTHFAGKPIYAIDGVMLNVPDTKENAVFGRPRNQNETSAAYPHARLVGIVECGTHAMIAAEIGTHAEGEITLAKRVLPRVPQGALLLADRLYLCWELAKLAINQGCTLLWRLKACDRDRFKTLELLEDGSYRALYHPPKDPKARKQLDGIDLTPIPVRVCSYSVEGGNAEDVHLITTMLDENSAPAAKLAELYMQRWEIELVFKEMKIQLNDNETALRSNRPDLVRQEIYGLVMMHYAIRSLMYEAAVRAKLDPDVISFKGAMKIIRRKSLRGGYFSP